MAKWLEDNAETFQKLTGLFLNPYIIGSNLFTITPRRPIHDVSARVMDVINEKIKELFNTHRRVVFMQTNEDEEKEQTLDKILIGIINDYIDIVRYNYITECIYDENCEVCYKRLLHFINHLEKEVETLEKNRKSYA
ncbi:MAG: hypothetical protein R3250_07170 [Melioribacteraceae bacterium]|nr:hypothetical protein [Melioribacteraceae bacterium]